MRFLSIVLVSILAIGSVHADTLPTKQQSDDRSFSTLNVDKFTDAPQRVLKVARLDAPPEVVFEKIANHRNMKEWAPMIEHWVEVDNSNSITPGLNNVGTIRVCPVGGNKIVEDILWFEPGVGYAYHARADTSPALVDHLGVMALESDGNGGSYLVWRQYFKNNGTIAVQSRAMAAMMPGMLESAFDQLIEVYGGEVVL